MQEELSSNKVIVTRADGPGARLTVKMSMTPRTGEASLKEKYGVTKYDLGTGYEFPEALKKLVPSNVPEYVDQGENYVERVIRALYFFKQCALIGPSGTGKTHIVYLVAKIAGLPLWEINCGLRRPCMTFSEGSSGWGRRTGSTARLYRGAGMAGYSTWTKRT